ncbi:Metallo-dependent phosphatase-like protein [Cunninghamella echinulata]|nr:Metallo-dependent phosphatase-like protein [Cunninghamella echinulata]
MKPKVIARLCFIITILCSLRACQLYWSSTKELRSTRGSLWPFSHKKDTDSELKVRQSTIQQNISQQIHILDDKLDGLFYFTQISDLHISKYRAKGHTIHFLQFIQSVLPIIKPEFVVVTGDLTDAKDRKRITSQQYIEEWKVYKAAIEQQTWTNTTWYDMRGNHDCFDLPSWQSRVNLYRTYGQSANKVEEGQGIYSWNHTQPYGDYQFVAIDACPKRGPSRPFNFFGYLTSNTMDRLSHALMKPANHTFVFSHYPTTTMVFGVSQHGLGDILQSYDPMTQTLELELGDMKDHGMYRIVAVDHDIISFVDARLPQAPSTQTKKSSLIPLMNDNTIEWPDSKPAVPPVILITNPKDARFVLDKKEPLDRIQSSSHIRFLVFTDQPPDQLTIQIKIDGKLINANYKSSNDNNGDQKENFTRYVGNKKNPLWVHPWNPLDYQYGSHVLSIQVKTSSGLIGESTILFRTDGKRLDIEGGAGEWIISSHMTTLVNTYDYIYT